MKMIYSKSFLFLFLIVLFLSVAGFSGCVGNDADTSGSDKITGDSVKVWSASGFEGEPDQTVLAKGRQFVDTSITIQSGETVRIWNREVSAHYDHLYHSQEDAFDDIYVKALGDTFLTFNKPGTYHIDLNNPATNSYYSTTGNTTLTVTVTK
ncbi:hypothetical protein [Methanolapillus ohkumae]|uniref:EfeO-type cupredoxin-like domain-containing protein n=1 Tax=Methanolapillus ohkumae TaxID=3028298 RepID=A0AA96V5J8_9EURY|nr:hypothetical protein MsAm2_09230 [Methanosarcinaceae archaeon Am2]